MIVGKSDQVIGESGMWLVVWSGQLISECEIWSGDGAVKSG